MSASPKPSKFQGLFKQAAESPLPANEPDGRIEHEELAELAIAPQPVRQESPPAPTQVAEPVRPIQARAGQGASSAAEKRQPGRPAGKRTDKDWKQFSVLLRHEDQFEAVNVLRSTRDKRDFSMLMQSLLEGWLKRQGQGK
jgi:hypothetical protein